MQKKLALGATPVFVALMPLAFPVASCGLVSPPAVPGDGATCSIEPPGATAAPLSPLESHLGIELLLDEQRLLREIERHVPRTLAKGKNQSIGVAGRVSYRIDRGGFSLTPGERELVVNTQLEGDIDVCKPLGPFCPNYGSCQPRWSVRVTIPIDFDTDPSLRARSEVQVVEGCILRPVGYDATPELKRITSDEARKVQARLRRELSRAEAELQERLRQAAEPVPLRGGGCLLLGMDEITYAPVVRRGSELRAAAQARGRLTLGCLAGAPTAARDESRAAANDPVGVSRTTPTSVTPPLRRDAKLEPHLDVAVAAPLGFEKLSAELSASGPVRLKATQPPAGDAPTADDESVAGNALYLTFDPPRSCAVWVKVDPQVAGDRLVFRVPEASAASAELRVRIAGLSLARPDVVASVKQALDDSLEQLAQREREFAGEGVSVSLEPRYSESVRVAPSALEWVQRVTGHASVSVAAQTR